MKNESYKPRICDEMLKLKLRTSGAVLISGPKWCGKTWTALNAANSVIYMQDPDKKNSYKQLAQTKPSLLLQGEKPLLIDEWQMATELWDAVRFAVDRTPEKGQFILTGSVVVEDDGNIAHTGTGRIAALKMRPMSLFESGESNGAVSLKALFDGEADIEARSSADIEDLAHAICRGGWPAALNMEREDSLDVVRNYVDAIVERDAGAIDGSSKNPDRMRSILKSLARNISTMTTDSTIMEDVKANDISLSDKTLSSYLTALRRLFVVEDIKAWQPSLRSKTGIRTSDKRQFVDPSIAAAALEMQPRALIMDFNFFGFMFESLCARDLRIYAEPLRGSVRHYHDRSDLEADLIISLNDGRWAAVEVKLGSKEIDSASANLKKLVDKIDTSRFPAPSFLMVLTGGEFAYRRDDGVLVVPLACLRD